MDNARWTLNDSIKSRLRQFYDWNEQKSLSPCTYNCIMWLFLGTLRTLISILAKSVIHILLGVSVWNLIGIICLDMSFKHEADTKSMNTIIGDLFNCNQIVNSIALQQVNIVRPSHRVNVPWTVNVKSPISPIYSFLRFPFLNNFASLRFRYYSWWFKIPKGYSYLLDKISGCAICLYIRQ